jgi:oligopeptide transport system substrate-binding protein
MTKHWLCFLVFPALQLALSGLGCSDRGRERQGTSTLRVQLGAEPMTLDPARTEDGVAMKILGNTMDGLVGYDNAGHLESRLADTYRISADRRHYEFTIRNDAKWSDGKPVRAEDFVTGLRRSLAKETAGKLAPLLFSIRNAREYNQGKVPADALGVHAKNGELVIDLTKPVSYFVHALTLNMALPAREDLLRQTGGKWLESFPVTGPYQITKHIAEEKIILERNPYSLASTPISKVEIDIVPDESTGLHLFEQGKLDIISKIPDTEFARLRAQDRVHTDPLLAVYYLAFNVRKAPFDQVRNRRAVAASIRKQELVDVLHTGDTVAASWIPRGLEGYFSDPFASRLSAEDLKAAKDDFMLLQPVAAGFDTSMRNRWVLEKIQQDLSSKLGLKLSLENLDWKSYIRSVQTDAAPVFRFAWLAPFDDPIVHLRVFETDNPNNYSHFSDKTYDRLVNEIEILRPGKIREAKLREAQEILLSKDAVVIPLYHYVQNHAVAERVENFHVSPYGIVRFRELRLKDEP